MNKAHENTRLKDYTNTELYDLLLVAHQVYPLVKLTEKARDIEGKRAEVVANWLNLMANKGLITMYERLAMSTQLWYDAVYETIHAPKGVQI